MKKVLTVVAAAVFAVAAAHVSESQACTRLVYLGPDNTVFDRSQYGFFSIDIPANLWIFPRGMERRGMVGPNSIQWTSKIRQRCCKFLGYFDRLTA